MNAVEINPDQPWAESLGVNLAPADHPPNGLRVDVPLGRSVWNAPPTTLHGAQDPLPIRAVSRDLCAAVRGGADVVIWTM